MDRRAITAWLTCAECTADELGNVVQGGRRMVRYLEAAVSDGPPRHMDSLATLLALEGVARTKRYRQSHQLAPLSPAESTAAAQRASDVFDLTWRLRAAQAWGRIERTAASSGVAEFCAANPPALTRRPEFKAALKLIGDCP